MQIRHRWLFGALVGTSIGCAHLPSGEKAAPAPRVFVTGSHIPRPVDPVTGAPRTMSSLRVYGRQEILETGRQGDLSAALRAQVPVVW